MDQPVLDAIARGEGFLTETRNPDGSWPYEPGGPGHSEPTLLAAAAGMPLAADWLKAQPKSWPHLLLPAVVADTDRPLALEVSDWILAQQSVPSEKTDDFDATIPAWSWVTGTAAWVEPTSYAILSLVRMGMGAERVAEGRRLLRDRQCTDGGWNYGNPRMLGAELPGQTGPTGWALLAFERTEPGAARALQFLDRTLTEPSTLGLSVATLAAVHHDRDAMPYALVLAPRVGAQGARGRIDLTALAVSALRSASSRHVVFDPHPT